MEIRAKLPWTWHEEATFLRPALRSHYFPFWGHEVKVEGGVAWLQQRHKQLS